MLYADDETSIQELMRIELPRMGHEATVCPDGRTALAALERTAYDCVIVDLDMPGVGGVDVIRRLREISPDTEAVIITGKSSLETAVDAVRQGVCDYLTKPCKLADIQAVLERVRRKRELTARLRALEGRVRRAEGETNLVGRSAGLEQVRQLVARVARTDSTVLIRGETGTGKELVARAIHEASGRAGGPLVAVNCGALPEHLVESELFGHRKGAFTGADEHRTGLFEVADGGTLFLDEIGELPRSLQPKLLRALEAGEIRRVGENAPIRVDCRVLCATHRKLEEMVAAGDFREDLFFRINTFEVIVPPLRERVEDLPALVDHFIRRARPHTPPAMPVVGPGVMEVLTAHQWPGNVRELANVLEHAVVLCDELPVGVEHLPARLGRSPAARHPAAHASQPPAAQPPAAQPPAAQPPAAQPPAAQPPAATNPTAPTAIAAPAPSKAVPADAVPSAGVPSGGVPGAADINGHSAEPQDRPPTLREIELKEIVERLKRNGGNKVKTAEELGISLKTLYNKLHQVQATKLDRSA